MNAAGVAQANADRLRVETDLNNAKARHRAALQAQAAECSTGKGKKCEGRRATTEALERLIGNLEVRLGSLVPAQRENAGYAHAAEVLAAIPLESQRMQRRLKLLLPFVVVVIAEVATIAFLGIGIEHKPISDSNDKPDSVPPQRKSRRGATKCDPKVVAFVAAFRRSATAATPRLLRSRRRFRRCPGARHGLTPK
jgi:hypothetical protein